MDHVGGVRRGVASICDRSFDLISILGKIDFEQNSYIGIENIVFEIRPFEIDLDQTAPPKMTAMTIGWYQVFCGHIDLTRFLPLTCRFSRQTLISIFPRNWIISFGINILGGAYPPTSSERRACETTTRILRPAFPASNQPSQPAKPANPGQAVQAGLQGSRHRFLKLPGLEQR